VELDGKPITWGERKVKAEALLAEERRKALELDMDEREGRLHKTEDVERAVSEMVGRVRARVLGMPSKLAPLLADREASACFEILEGEVREALSELAGGWVREGYEETPSPLPSPAGGEGAGGAE